MPRRAKLDRDWLKGPRFDSTRRGMRGRQPRESLPLVVVDGHPLNEPESAIYRALEDLNIAFQAQVSLGPGRALGGALVDFALWGHGIAIEYQGPFHDTTEGKAKDFWRTATRMNAGLQTVYVYERDLKRLHARLKEIIGTPMASSILTAR